MSKLGAYEYPSITFSESLKLANIIEDKFAGSIKDKTSLSSLASLLRHKNVKSGGFVMKIVSMKRYGLLKDQRLTDMAEILLHPKSEQERQNALMIALNSTDLFKKLFDKIGTDTKGDNFWEYLVAITSASRQDCINASGKIRKLYEDLVKNIKVEKSLGGKQMPVQELSDANTIQLRSGSIYMEVPKDSENIDMIIGMLQKWKKKKDDKK